MVIMHVPDLLPEHTAIFHLLEVTTRLPNRDTWLPRSRIKLWASLTQTHLHKQMQRLKRNHEIVLQDSPCSDPDVCSYAKPGDHPS